MEKLKNVHEITEDENCAVKSGDKWQSKSSDIKRCHSTRQLNSIENNCLICNKEDSKGKFETSNDFEVRPIGQTWKETVKWFWLIDKNRWWWHGCNEKKKILQTITYVCSFNKKVNNVTKNDAQMESENECFLWDCFVRSNKPYKKIFEISSGSHPIFLLAVLREMFNKTFQQHTNKVYNVHHIKFETDLLRYMPRLKVF